MLQTRDRGHVSEEGFLMPQQPPRSGSAMATIKSRQSCKRESHNCGSMMVEQLEEIPLGKGFVKELKVSFLSRVII